MLPLDADKILQIWKAIEPFEFGTTIGNVGASGVMYIRERGDMGGLSVKQQVLESAKMAVRRMGWKEHALLEMTC